jgi:hypothetical protein
MYYDYYGPAVETFERSVTGARSRMHGMGDMGYSGAETAKDFVGPPSTAAGPSWWSKFTSSLTPENIQSTFKPLIEAGSVYSAVRTEPYRQQLQIEQARRAAQQEALRRQAAAGAQTTEIAISPWTWVAIAVVGAVVIGGVIYARKRGA